MAGLVLKAALGAALAGGAAIGVVAVVSDGGGGAAPGAVLEVAEVRVERAEGNGRFSAAEDGDRVEVGHTVRTDDSGRAQLDFDDGSLARLGPSTELVVTELAAGAGDRRIATQLDVGATWHRVADLTGTDTGDDAYEVETAVATASVRGTTFAVECPVRGTCRFSVLDGIVAVDPEDGPTLELRAGQRVEVEDGVAGEVQTFAPDELLSDPWIRDNVGQDPGNGNDPAQAILDGDWTTTIKTESGPTVTRSYRFDTAPCDAPPCPLEATIDTSSGPVTVPVALSDGRYRFTAGFPIACGDLANALQVVLTVELEVTDVEPGRPPEATELTGSIAEGQTALRPSACAPTTQHHELRAVRA